MRCKTAPFDGEGSSSLGSTGSCACPDRVLVVRSEMGTMSLEGVLVQTGARLRIAIP